MRWRECDCLSRRVLSHSPRQATASLILSVRQNMKTRMLNVLAIACGVVGVALGVIALMFAGSALMRISDGAAVAMSAVLSVFHGLAAFLYIRAFISYRKSPGATTATDILVGIAFVLWVTLTTAPSFPDEISLFDYAIPKSIFHLVVSYGFYRISKLVLIKNEKGA